jgi:hypothetical protein
LPTPAPRNRVTVEAGRAGGNDGLHSAPLLSSVTPSAETDEQAAQETKPAALEGAAPVVADASQRESADPASPAGEVDFWDAAYSAATTPSLGETTGQKPSQPLAPHDVDGPGDSAATRDEIAPDVRATGGPPPIVAPPAAPAPEVGVRSTWPPGPSELRPPDESTSRSLRGGALNEDRQLAP